MPWPSGRPASVLAHTPLEALCFWEGRKGRSVSPDTGQQGVLRSRAVPNVMGPRGTGHRPLFVGLPHVDSKPLGSPFRRRRACRSGNLTIQRHVTPGGRAICSALHRAGAGRRHRQPRAAAGGGWDYAAGVGRETSDGVSALHLGDAFGNFNPDRDGFNRRHANLRGGYTLAPGQRNA